MNKATLELPLFSSLCTALLKFNKLIGRWQPEVMGFMFGFLILVFGGS